MKKKIFITFIFLALLFALLYSLTFFTKKTQFEQSYSPLNDVEWITLAESTETVKRGAVQYYQRCKKCHGMDANGGVKAPSLKDDVWLYGNSYNEIYHSIFYTKGNMKGYGKKLIDDDLYALTIYIKSLQTKKETKPSLNKLD